ncbi:MAG: PEP/pyruvate-binding domain-containing protein [Candidatus Neomarinimicrobiota bacterium]
MRKVDFLPTTSFNFHELMPNRVYEILLVASPYDAFILEEDGQLSEQILNEYLGMNFTAAPRLWRAATGNRALEMLTKRKFDLIIVMSRIADMDPVTFGTRVKERHPKKPVILLASDESEINHLPVHSTDSPIDKIFMWSGNANVFPAIIKYIEDKLNVRRDVRIADVRVIIVIEDTPRDYSVILPLIYKVIVNYTNQLMSKSLNAAQRLIHLRGRPKILLTSTYEEAQKYYRKYPDNVLGIISDIDFPKDGKKDPEAGVKFARWIRKYEPAMPIMLQSRDQNVRERADLINAHFLFKKSTRLLRDIEDFVIRNFGFGDFVFRMPDGQQIAMASNLPELLKLLATIPDDSLVYHANHNHFSNWLAARGEFEMASEIRPLRQSNFKSTDDHRAAIMRFIEVSRTRYQDEQVIDFSTDSFDPKLNFIRLAKGSLGGKARGLAFARKMIKESEIKSNFPNVSIRVPNIAVIGTDEFDRFMKVNNLWEPALALNDNSEIDRLFLMGALSPDLTDHLKVYLSRVRYPLAVRSSSLLEDSAYQSLAGLYATFMYPNDDSDLNRRLVGLSNLVKLVYASMFHPEPRAILQNTTRHLEEEKMAVVIQELIGRRYGDYFYPNFSGVAQNYNYYPISYMKRDEGVAFVALGFGKTVVEGEKALRFSPKYPAILPQFFSVKATIAASQNSFYALQLGSRQSPDSILGLNNLVKLPLARAERDSTLKFVGSVVSAEDAVIRDSLHYPGTRVVTFAPILKWQQFPLAEIIVQLLNVGKLALGGPVEIEFAVNIPPDSSARPEFCLLQIRPMHYTSLESTPDMTEIVEKDIVARSHVTLGDGTIDSIRNIIYVKQKVFNPAKTLDIAREIEKFNQTLGNTRPYILIGPGRWGSADTWLGIPVRWDQISNSRVIVEVGLEKYSIDPSFGSHFFQIVTSLRIAYFTINPKNSADKLDWFWLDSVPPSGESQYLRWLEFPDPLRIQIDGVTGKGIILPVAERQPEIEPMDEQQSTGI